MADTPKVLLLDDNEDARLLQQTILESGGYEVVTAENGKKGLEILETFTPDIIVSDILMPEMDGFEFGMKVKQDERLKTIPFVFYSAQYTDEADRNLVDEIGADRFIIKPIEMEAFLAIIGEVLEAHRPGEPSEAVDTPQSSAEMAEGDTFDREHYRAQARMLDKKLQELELEHEKLSQSEAQYRRLVEGLSRDYFIYRCDEKGIPTYISPAVTDMLGYSREEFTANYRSYLTESPGNTQAMCNMERALKGERVPSYEIELYAKDGSVRTLQVSEQPLFDSGEKISGIEGVARDITNEKQSAKKLHKALIDIIKVVSMTLEKRDPYTAGHQQRVAALAVAIGEAMQFDKARLEGLRLGALVHDIGKITIPAEILTKPGRLTEIEYRLIQSHPVEGFEILENIEFPWPLAQMVSQHHERLDGSGYPDGLRGDQILLEAKILCVADVVEAMTSDRPYRPGLGFDAAIEEIERHSGSLYDEEVVRCCIRILKEESFSFQ